MATPELKQGPGLFKPAVGNIGQWAKAWSSKIAWGKKVIW
jgi:hypothetical protein